MPQSLDTGPLVPYQPPAGVVTVPPQDIPQPAPVEISPQGNQAVAVLLDSASNYVSAGELDKAAAALERALRIEPKNAGIWHDLAQIRLHQRQYQEAESMATKSNSLTNDRSLKARNWQLIAVARRAVGNDAGADEAEAQAYVLGGG
jgi:predicted Zn-dependent protease